MRMNENVIPNQKMFATHQYIPEGAARRAPTICHILFSNWYYSTKKQNNHFGGGLGDATVTQSGVWGRIPQFFWLL
ncbi:hypothetical protein FDUTEX481_06763 [Tolypothrix sp. PCC 7601]|nr:hypothetical protein FDUTEX481_06763 [Tolypothrix sp. PCC 7601]